ncbi:MAG: non-ribosomal peptide synthetase, partial [bacterium]|nr:non-ribosomal peptide synthetase [bacterium]
TDGPSMELLIKEFTALYAGEKLPPLTRQYKDFSQWQNSTEQQTLILRQEDFWLKYLEGDIAALDLPFDFPVPENRSFDGEKIDFNYSTAWAEALQETAAAHNATLYMVLLAVTNILFKKIGNRDDILIGTPVAARQHADLEHIIGVFVNTLVTRNQPADHMSFSQFLKQVKTNTLAAFDNQDYPFRELAKRKVPKRSSSRTPLFDVMFELQNFEMQIAEMPGLTLESVPLENRTAKFDLTLTAVQYPETITFILEYNTRLFKKETAQKMAAMFTHLTGQIIDNPHKKIAALQLEHREEKKKSAKEKIDTKFDILEDKNGKVIYCFLIGHHETDFSAYEENLR